MIQQDSIQVLNDSTSVLLADSLARIDSLAKVDSIRTADSIKALVSIPGGHLGIPHPSFPQTESWVFGILLLLFLIMTFSISRSANLLIDAIKTFFQVKERSSIFSKTTINNFRFRFLIIIFSIGVFSFYTYLITNYKEGFYISGYFLFYAVTALFFILKSLVFDLIGYVFLETSSLKLAKESYFNIISFLGISLFPVLTLRIYVSAQFINIIDIIALILCILAFILVIIKLFQIFMHKIVASFYIMLYLCTLEILPLFILFQVYKLII